MPRTSKKGDQSTWYMLRSLRKDVENIQKNEKLSRNETINLLVQLGIRLNKHRALLALTAERKNTSQDAVLDELFEQVEMS
jgi:hypothetical protein